MRHINVVTMAEIGRRSDSDPRLSLGVTLGLGLTPEVVGSAYVITEAEAERVVKKIRSFEVPDHRRRTRRKRLVPA